MNAHNELTALVKDVTNNRGLKRVFFTGFSFGGALAALYFISAAEELLSCGVDVRCVTFGCPRFIQTRDIVKLPAYIKARVLNIINDGSLRPFELEIVTGSECEYTYVGSVIVQTQIEIPRQKRLSDSPN